MPQTEEKNTDESKSFAGKNASTTCAMFLLGLVMLASCPCSQAQKDEASSGLIQRNGIVYSATLGKVYVVDSAHNMVSSISPDDSVRSVRTGSNPLAIAVNEHTGMVYVANSGGRSVTVIDGATEAVIATISTAARPYAIAVNASTNKVYVSNTFSNLLTVIDGKTNLATSIKTGSADAVLIDESRGHAYLMGYESNTLNVLDMEIGSITKQPAGATHLWGIMQSGSTLYVTHVQDATMAAINVDTRDVKEIPTGQMPCALAINTVTHEIYVANYADRSVTVVDSRSGTAVATVNVGGHPQAIAIDEARGLIYVVQTRENTITVIDAHTHRVVKSRSASDHPYAIAVNTKTHNVYSANMGTKPFSKLEIR